MLHIESLLRQWGSRFLNFTYHYKYHFLSKLLKKSLASCFSSPADAVFFLVTRLDIVGLVVVILVFMSPVELLLAMTGVGITVPTAAVVVVVDDDDNDDDDDDKRLLVAILVVLLVAVVAPTCLIKDCSPANHSSSSSIPILLHAATSSVSKTSLVIRAKSSCNNNMS